MEEVNKKSSYKMIEVRDKLEGKGQGEAGKEGSENGEIKISKGETDLNSILKKRIQGIQDEMGVFNKNISEFANACDSELSNLIGNINLLQRNLGYLN